MSKRKDPNRNTCKHVLAPGFWIDESDNLHVSAYDMCVAVGLEPTAENVALAMKVAEEMIKDMNPDCEIRLRDTPKD